MKLLLTAIFSLLCFVGTSSAAPQSSQKMRPYTGVGILQISTVKSEQDDQIFLYDEPSLFRRGELKYGSIPPYEWIFGTTPGVVPMVVAAAKGQWLRVVYDDAGREAWLSPSRKNSYLPWNSFFKQHISRLLPGLNKKYYQSYRTPGDTPKSVLSPSQTFKVLRLENDWAQIMPDPDSIVWVRWRDEDGRLLMGISTPLVPVQP